MDEATPLTFEASDKLDLKKFSEKLERFLMVEHDFVDGSLVVSLNAPFGAGKSTFLSMWKSDFDKRRETNPTLPKAVIITTLQNTWNARARESVLCVSMNTGIETLSVSSRH
jgi:hypothetical protein